MEIDFAKDGEATIVTANDISVSVNAMHLYNIDWEALSKSEKGVILEIDDLRILKQT